MIVERLLQFSNTCPPYALTLHGISIDIMFMQSLKHLYSKLVTEDGISIDFNDVQPRNAPTPIEVTDDGKTTFVKFTSSSNISCEIDDNDAFDKSIDFNGLIPENAYMSNCILSDDTTIELMFFA